LVRYIRNFDVCIVPYVDSLYTATVVPTKINEYLAVGKPVVSTKLPAVCDFNEQHNVLLTSIGQPDDFLQAIEQALNSPMDAAIAARRREVAALGDWLARLEAMSELIKVELQAKAEQTKEKASS
jgi:glycosyltransferase involved in cell wall biosynthesis